ncbi:hypothetical protein MXD62_19595 [Frankia sp. Mgl5]|uniref:hypothetical protein n=1 Tax=Frankia sp. Mgl5 TaxID=2933793 RepID=UPI00200DA122|nr:hypothetical protein [Frankia sp. Mgl5]MCK9929357.1 hypothetical protein [Frankia sp. Mgl5]
MSRGLPGSGRRTVRRVRIAPAAEPKADGNRAARRAWKRWEARNATQAAFPPEDTSDAGEAAHGAAGRHGGPVVPHWQYADRNEPGDWCPLHDGDDGPCWCPDDNPDTTEETETP